jgi:aspartate aminotransferase-like enzyme
LPYRLRLPGPTAVPERVRQALAAPVINHRGPEFHALFAEIERGLKPIFGTEGPVLVFPGSGTGVMEAALANVAPPGAAVLVIANGQYGKRFHQIAQTPPPRRSPRTRRKRLFLCHCERSEAIQTALWIASSLRSSQ